MSVSLYFDVHVPYAITFGLRLRGVDVLTSQEDGTREVDDDVLLDRATALGRVLFSQDKDLLLTARPFRCPSQSSPSSPSLLKSFAISTSYRDSNPKLKQRWKTWSAFISG
jgi:Domain of unknown function (DUF5615)